MELEITFFGPSHSVFELTCSLTGSKSSSRSVSGTLHEAPSENLMTSSSFTLSIFPTQESITTSQNELLRGWTKTSRLIVLFHFNTVYPINSICRLLWLTFIVFIFNSIMITISKIAEQQFVGSISRIFLLHFWTTINDINEILQKIY